MLYSGIVMSGELQSVYECTGNLRKTMYYVTYVYQSVGGGLHNLMYFSFFGKVRYCSFTTNRFSGNDFGF